METEAFFKKVVEGMPTGTNVIMVGCLCKLITMVLSPDFDLTGTTSIDSLNKMADVGSFMVYLYTMGARIGLIEEKNQFESLGYKS